MSFVKPYYSKLLLKDKQGVCFVKTIPELTGESIINAEVETDKYTGRPIVTFNLNREGSEKLYRITSDNIGKSLAVVLDGKVIFIAKILERIRGSVRTSGSTLEEAFDLANALKNGGLPCPISIVHEEFLE